MPSAAGSPTRLFPPDQPGSALEQVKADITSRQNLNQRRERTYPRVLKRARHNSPPAITLVNLPKPQAADLAKTG